MFDPELPIGPSIADASQTSALFQTDHALAEGRRRREKKERQLGNPIDLTTKALCMALAPAANTPTTTGNSHVYAYVGGANHAARKVNLMVTRPKMP
jgi:hypothetical protein